MGTTRDSAITLSYTLQRFVEDSGGFLAEIIEPAPPGWNNFLCPAQLVLLLPDAESAEVANKQRDYNTKMLRDEWGALRRLEKTGVTGRLLFLFNKDWQSNPDLAQSSNRPLATVKVKLDGGGEFEPPAILRTYMDGVTLREWLHVYAAKNRGNPAKPTPKAWFTFFDALMNLLQQTHRQRITHGYLSPANLIVDKFKDRKEDGSAILADDLVPANLRLVNFTHRINAPMEMGIYRDGAEPFRIYRRAFDAPRIIFGSRSVPEDKSDDVRRILGSQVDLYLPADLFSAGLVLFYYLCGTGELPHPYDAEEPTPAVLTTEAARDSWSQIKNLQRLKSNAKNTPGHPKNGGAATERSDLAGTVAIG